MRQQIIEETFRLLEQEFSWGRSRARKAQAQIAHLHLGLTVLCLTQRAAYNREQVSYTFKLELLANLYLIIPLCSMTFWHCVISAFIASLSVEILFLLITLHSWSIHYCCNKILLMKINSHVFHSVHLISFYSAIV
jgi:hypothetical protein